MRFENGLKKELKIVEIIINGIKVEKSVKGFKEFKKEKFRQIRKKFTLENLKDNKIIRCYRDFYWSIGIDPTKIRPSSEALVRRVLKGKDIPEINNCVDAYNLASVLTLISMGAYDLDKIEGELIIRISKGEEFLGIGGKKIYTKGEIVMSDKKKIVSVLPYRDSDLTKVTTKTKEVIIVLCGVKGIPKAYLLNSASLTLDLVKKFCGGEGKIIG